MVQAKDRLSRTPRISENVFRLISTVFRIFRKPLLLQPETACKVTLAGCYLLRFLRKSASKNIYNPTGTFDSDYSDSRDVIPRAWRNDNGNQPWLKSFTQNTQKESTACPASEKHVRLFYDTRRRSSLAIRKLLKFIF